MFFICVRRLEHKVNLRFHFFVLKMNSILVSLSFSSNTLPLTETSFQLENENFLKPNFYKGDFRIRRPVF